MIAKLNFVSFAAALFCFFLPWLEFQCSEKVVVSQSGFQSTYGGGTLGPEFESRQQAGKENDSSNEIDPAIFIAGAFFCVVGGFLLSLISLFRRGRSGIAIPALAGIALILVALQMKIGFPLEHSVTKASKSGGGGTASLGQRLVSMNTRVVYRPWIYFELGALISPLGIAFFAMKPRKEA